MTKLSGIEWLKICLETQTDDCIPWPLSRDNKGYPQVCTGRIDAKTTKIEKANRVICRMAHGEPPTPEHQAAHSCGNRGCVNKEHLSWKTQGENEEDKKTHGTLVPNTWGRNGKLTTLQRAEIVADKTTPKVELAARYGVRRGTIEYHHNKAKKRA